MPVTMMAWETPAGADGRPQGETHLVLPTMARSLCGRTWMRLGGRWTDRTDRLDPDVHVCEECRAALAGLVAATFPTSRSSSRRG